MIFTAAEHKIQENVNMRGGDGTVIIEHLLSEKEMNQKGRLYAKITLNPNCSIGYHVHENETETFFVLTGTATYDDNGTSVTLNKGDVAHTFSGEGHAIANTGNEVLEIMALILFA